MYPLCNRHPSLRPPSPVIILYGNKVPFPPISPISWLLFALDCYDFLNPSKNRLWLNTVLFPHSEKLGSRNTLTTRNVCHHSLFLVSNLESAGTDLVGNNENFCTAANEVTSLCNSREYHDSNHLRKSPQRYIGHIFSCLNVKAALSQLGTDSENCGSVPHWDHQTRACVDHLSLVIWIGRFSLKSN